MLRVEREHAEEFFGNPIRISEKYPEYVKDQIRELIRQRQRIKYLTVILDW